MFKLLRIKNSDFTNFSCVEVTPFTEQMILDRDDPIKSIRVRHDSDDLMLEDNESKVLEEVDFESKEYSIKLWDSYYNALKIMRRYLQSEEEREQYAEENISLSKEAFMNLLDFVDKNKEVLIKLNNRLIRTTITETNRLYGAYLLDPLLSKLRLLLFILGQIDLYSRKQPIDEETFKKNVETMTLPFLIRIIDICHQNENQLFSLIDKLGWEMIAYWRQLFLKGKLTDLVTRRKRNKKVKIE